MTKLVRAFAGLLLAGGLATAASAQTKWDMPTPYPDGNFHTKNVAMFAADVAKATNGSLTITVHSAGSLIKHAEIKRAVRQGTAPIGEMLEVALLERSAGLRHRTRFRSSPPATTPRTSSTWRRSLIWRSSSPRKA